MSALALAYHGVATVPFDEDRHRLFVSPARLDRHLSLLRRWDYRLVTFAELAARRADPDRPAAGGPRLAALTFDDGLADNLAALVPVLRAHAAPATVFVVTGWLGGEHPDAPGHRILDEREVVALAGAGVEVASHGAGHHDLRSLGDDELAHDLVSARRHLEALLDAPVTSFAYPYGHADDRVRAAVAAAGYAAACRTSGAGHPADPFDQPRQAMGHGSGTVGLRLKRHDRYEAVMAFPGARAARRASRRAHSAWDRRSAARGPSVLRPHPG